MRYYLDLFKSDYATGSLGFVHTCLGVSLDRVSAYDNVLQNFEIDAVSAELTACLADSDCPTGFKAHVIRKKVPDAEISWLCVVTSTKITEEVVAILLRLAFKYNLVLMDRQNGCKAWRKEDLFKTCSVVAENRKSEINELLYNRKLMIFSLRQVESHFRNFSHNISYVMTLRYVQEKTPEERIREIYETIVDALVEGESLLCEHKCFAIRGRNYTITYCVEADKNANRVFYYEEGGPQVAPLNRMGVDFAFRQQFDYNHKLKNSDIWVRMNLEELIADYPNPADRFIASVNIKKTLKKLNMGVGYGLATGGYGAEVIFHHTEEITYAIHREQETKSGLRIDEASASFLLPIIEDFYPYMYERYYLLDNPLPYEMWQAILEKMQHIALLILHETNHEELKPYIDKFELFALEDGYFSDECKPIASGTDAQEWRDNPVQFLYKNRKKAFAFYKFFILWIEKQMENDGFSLINVSGP